ncbi:MAG TPA: nucleoside deaminase [Chitinophagales bacterium]|nr:nucleoside deaminase [Chitinophagales bacterium]
MGEQQHHVFMERAIALSKEGMLNEKGGPFGCVIVKNGKIIAEACNSVTSNNDPTAHAEIVAIRKACDELGNYQLEGCIIYTSCEPCPMCLGAIYWARPDQVFYANSKQDAANIGFDDDFIYKEIPLPDAERQINFKHFPLDSALQVFELWEEKGNKKLY